MLAALVAAGCGSTSSDAAPRHATTTRPASTERSTTTVDQEAADKAEITATFNGWGRLVGEFEAETTQWDEEKASRFVGGPVLEDARDWVPKWQAARKRAVRPKDSQAHFEAQKITITGDRAILRSCEVNDYITEAADGSILDDSVKTFFATWEARRLPDGWKLWSVTKKSSRSGVVRCGN